MPSPIQRSSEDSVNQLLDMIRNGENVYVYASEYPLNYSRIGPVVDAVAALEKLEDSNIELQLSFIVDLLKKSRLGWERKAWAFRAGCSWSRVCHRCVACKAIR